MQKISLLDPLSLFRRISGWRHLRYARSVPRLVFTAADLLKEGYFSQCGQDKWVAEALYPGLRNGVFLDIGAHDGVQFSNTCFLERTLGWSGIAVEPMPDIFERLKQNRSCTTINGCVADQPGKAQFQRISGYSEMLSGLVSQYDPRHQARIDRELKKYGGTLEQIEVECFLLNDLLANHDVRDVHYMNIDVEGAEYEIIRSIDFESVNIYACGIENNYADHRIPALMRKNGFDFKAIVGDEFYVRRQPHRTTKAAR